MTITQQLKERAREQMKEALTLRPEVTEIIMNSHRLNNTVHLNGLEKDLDTLIETTITELIEHIEGELMDVVDGFVFVENSELAKAMNKEVREQLQGYLRAMITNVLEDIKKGV